MKDVLIISDYDSGYAFSVMWKGEIYDKGELYEICYKHVNTYTYEMYDIFYTHTGNLNFKPMRKDLQSMNIFPREIILCSDGSIYTEKKENPTA
jgi:ABC-type dipeptide/oligopeptide/nickel transport system ATPase component